MKSIVFLDLDNTFWTDAGVPDSAIEAIRLAQANGHRVLTNTGRGRGECRDLSHYGLDGRCYAAGAEVFIGEDKIIDLPLGIETARMLKDALDIFEGIFIAEGGDHTFIHAYDQALFDELAENSRRADDPFFDGADVESMTDEDYAQIYKYSIFVEGGLPPEYDERIPSGFKPTRMGDATEFTRCEISKATALDAVRAWYEEHDGEAYRTVALGDSGNDIPMLKAADVAVCMGNGTPEAKSVADYVTRAIDDDGLYHAFEHLGLI